MSSTSARLFFSIKHLSKNVLFLLLLSSLVHSHAYAQKNASKRAQQKSAPAQTLEKPSDSGVPELTSKQMDQLALSAKKKSIITFLQIAKEKRGTSEEPVILLRIAETYQTCASIEFRLANRDATSNNKAVTLKNYKQYYVQSITYLNEIISKYSTSSAAPRSYYLRGKAYKELEHNQDAIRDFKFAADHYSDILEMPFALVALTDLYIDNKEYPLSIAYAKKLVELKGSTYPLALDRLSLVYFLQDDIDSSLKYIRQLISYYNSDEIKASYDTKEKALLNAASFYATAMTKKVPGYDALGGVKLLKKLEPTSEGVKPLIYFVNILRTKGFEKELDEIKDYAASGELEPAEGAQVVSAAFDYQLNKRQYNKINRTIEQLDGLISKVHESKEDLASLDKIKKSLASAIQTVQNDFNINKNKPEGKQVGSALVQLYSYTIRTAGSDESLKIRTTFNLAETHSLLNEFHSATEYYKWIVTSGKPTTPEEEKLKTDSAFKMIATRYEELKSKQIFPKDLTPTSIAKANQKKLPELVSEWIDWIDEYASQFEKHPQMDMMTFESDRLLYSMGYVEKVIDRTKKYIATYPNSEYSIALASLVIDTYVTAEDWKNTYDVSFSFYKNKKWKDANYNEKLLGIAGDAYFKTLEALFKAKDYKATLKYADTFISKFPKNKNIQNCMSLAANAALGLNDNRLALQWFNKLKASGELSPQLKSTALLTEAAVHEEQFRYDKAAHLFQTFLMSKTKTSFSEDDLNTLKRKTLLYTWMGGDLKDLNNTMNALCNKSLEADCNKYQLYLKLYGYYKASDSDLRKEFSKLDKISDAAAFVRTAYLLDNSNYFSIPDRKKILNSSLEALKVSDPIELYSILPTLMKTIPQEIEFQRQVIKKQARIIVDPKAISKRVNLVEENEKFFSQFLDTPWVDIKATALNEIANLYSDIASEIDALPRPKGLSAEDLKSIENTLSEIKSPFLVKIKDYRLKAFELASKNNTDSSIIENIAVAYFKENKINSPTIGMRDISESGLRSQYSISRLALKDIELVTQTTKKVLSKDEPEHLLKTSDEVISDFKVSMHEALKNRNWPRIAFMIREASQKSIIDSEILDAYKGFSFIAANSRPEGLPLIRDAKSSLEKEDKLRLNLFLIVAAHDAFDMEHAKEYIEEFFDLDGHKFVTKQGSPYLADVLLRTAQWSGAKMSYEILSMLNSLKSKGQRLPASKPTRGRHK